MKRVIKLSADMNRRLSELSKASSEFIDKQINSKEYKSECMVCKEMVPLNQMNRTNYLGHKISEREGFAFWHDTCGGKIKPIIPFEYHEEVTWSIDD